MSVKQLFENKSYKTIKDNRKQNINCTVLKFKNDRWKYMIFTFQTYKILSNNYHSVFIIKILF